jgi:hypothetical protein
VGVSSFTNAKPKRLYRDASNWVLEIERLVPLDDRVLRPTLQKLVGSEVVLFQLANSDEGRSLLGDARRLMAENAADDASYECEEGRWIPAAFLAQISPKYRPVVRGDAPVHARPAALAAPTLEITMLREELRELRTAHEKLQRRVAYLERNGGGGVAADDGARERDGRPAPSIRGRAPNAVETKAKAASPTAGVGAAPAPAPAAPAAPASEAKLPAAPLKPAYAMKMPTPDALVAQMSAMIGEKSRLSPTKKPLDLTAKDLWVSLMIDDAKNVVGAMVANLEAVVSEGAHLMLLPEHEIAEQIKTRTPTEAVTSAMAEILNVCTSAFNAVPDNLHIRAVPLEPVTPEMAAWLKTPGPRLDLGDGQGALAFVLKGEGT